jgi:sugar transferase (PEP-CTERM/EpsH1 system associated)
MTATATASIPAATPSPPVRRVLMLTHRLPYPPDRGDRIRSYHLLTKLARHFEVAIACTSDEPVWLQHHQLLHTLARRVAIQPTSAAYSRLRGAAALLAGKALTPAWHFRPGLAEQISLWHQQAPFQAVLTFCTGMIQYARLITQPQHPRPGAGAIRHVLDLVDVDSLKWEAYAAARFPPLSWAYRAEAGRLRQIEAGTLDRFDAVTVVSPHEAQAYRQSVGPHPGLRVVPNGVDLEYFSPLPDAPSKTIVFVGVLNYWPNVQGVTWFIEQVMPALRRRVPEVRLQVVGRHPTAALQQLGALPGVEIVGSVPDVRPYLADAVAVIAPLRLARGLQNKVLEAMSCTRAVVCSPGAAQGVAAVEGRDLLIADAPAQWVEHLERLLADAGHRRRIALAARAYVQEYHDWDRCLEPMIGLLRGDAEPV